MKRRGDEIVDGPEAKKARTTEEALADIVEIVTPPLSLPFQVTKLTLVEICRTVYERLLEEDAIADLTLPPRTFLERFSLAQVLARITFSFNVVSTLKPTDVPSSYTLQGRDGGKTSIVINYAPFEAERRPQLMHARMLHEITHAIRCELVRLCSALPEAGTSIPEECLEKRTPQKPCQERVLREPLLYLEGHELDSGYWMEHQLLGGIWVSLSGVFFFDQKPIEMIKIGEEGLLAMVRMRRPKARKLKIGDEVETFDELQFRYIADEEFYPMYHSGAITTRCGVDGEHSRVL